jgi:hypothetical protein
MGRKKMSYHKEIIVASIDILGISNILQSSKGANKVTGILGKIWVDNVDPNIYAKPDFSSKKTSQFWKSMKFGDSIYILAHPDDKPKVQLQKMITRVVGMIPLGLFKYNAFLRCGIAKGDLLISNVKIKNAPPHLKDYSEEIYIGTSMSNARKLETNQMWIGGAIQGDIDCKNCDNYLIEYPVPPKKCKNDKRFVPKYALNWLKFVEENEGVAGLTIDKIKIFNRIDSIARSIGNINEDVKTKIKNTKEFIVFILGEK